MAVTYTSCPVTQTETREIRICHRKLTVDVQYSTYILRIELENAVYGIVVLLPRQRHVFITQLPI